MKMIRHLVMHFCRLCLELPKVATVDRLQPRPHMTTKRDWNLGRMPVPPHFSSPPPHVRAACFCLVAGQCGEEHDHDVGKMHWIVVSRWTRKVTLLAARDVEDRESNAMSEWEASGWERVDGTGYEPTPLQLLTFARDKLKANYIFWHRLPENKSEVLQMLNWCRLSK